MTTSYLLLNGGVPLAVLALLWRSVRKLNARRALLNLLALALLTAVFDNLIIGLGIVDYDSSRILGLRIGLVPVEDFGYTLAAAYALPALYRWLGERGIDGN